MLELQDCYEKLTDTPFESVGEGKLYAGKFRDNWYRYATFVTSAFSFPRDLFREHNMPILCSSEST